jgi:cardiolipin synthase
MTLQLLVDAAEFWKVLERDVRAARNRIWLQTLSFEADGAGLPLAEVLVASAAHDRRLLVDAFCRHIISDRFIHAPRNRFDAELQAEVRATQRMFAELRAGGIRIGITNPAGMLWHRLPARDHRKLILIDDDVAYIGGINFSEHNFAWHDLMIRVAGADVVRFLAADFEATWHGVPVNGEARFPGIELHNLSGHGNEGMTARTLEVIRSARRSILAITPYLTFPFTDAMAEARRNGAAVTILSPAINNRVSLRRYVHRLAHRHGFALRHYLGRMSHLKAMLIDDEVLITGSTNFDWPTYHILAETIAIIDDAQLVDEFRQRVVQPDLQNSVAVEAENSWVGKYAELQHRVWAAGARWLSRPVPGKRVRHMLLPSEPDGAFQLGRLDPEPARD